MPFAINEVLYELTWGSDVIRDGMFMEATLEETGDTLAEVFCSDETGLFTISVYAENLPLELLERPIAAARETLPPRQEAP
jgi:hypothetical protein